MPMGSTAEAIWREQLRTFHLAGHGLEDMSPAHGLRPAILSELNQIPLLESSYPVYVAPGQPPKALAEILGNFAHSSALVAAFRAAMGERVLVALAEVRDAAIGSINRQDNLDELGKGVPVEGWLISFHAEALPLLYAATLAARRQKLQSGFFDKVKQCLAGIEGLLAVDDAHQSEFSPSGQISASLGMEAQTFFEPSAMEKALDRPRNTADRMDPERRKRCESTFATLATALGEQDQQPLFWLFHSLPAPPGVSAFGGQCRESLDNCAAALDLCNQQLEWLVPVLRAMRIARLEVESAFDPAVHAKPLERFEWQTADREELEALPAVVVMESADRLAQMSLTSFARVLRSGRPVQILVPSPGLYVEDLSGMVPDFGYLSMAHREAVVVQSSLAHLNHLLQGLVEVTRTLRPAVAVVSVPETSESEPAAWLENSMYVLSRAFPLYRYDPDRAPRRERFELFEPGQQFAQLTTAHVLALSKDFRRHFRVIPASAWDDEQIEIVAYLAGYDTTAPLAIPYVWVADETGERRRAVFTRDLINLCRDRSRAWEIFADLTGARESGGQDIDQAQYEKGRQEGTSQTINFVLAMLADPNTLHQ